VALFRMARALFVWTQDQLVGAILPVAYRRGSKSRVSTVASGLRAALPALLVVMSTMPPAHADEPVLHFALPDLPPWVQVRPDGGADGFGAVWANMLLRRAGVSALVLPMPYRRLMTPSADRDFMLIPDGADTEKAQIRYLAKLIAIPYIAVAHRGFPLHSLADLARIGPIAYERGVEEFDTRWMAEIGPGLQVAPNLDTAVQMLNLGRVNAVLASELPFDEAVGRLKAGAAIGDRIPMFDFEVWLAARVESADTPAAHALVSATKQLAATDAFAEIMRGELERPPAKL